MYKKSFLLILFFVIFLVIFRIFIVESCTSKYVEYSEIKSQSADYVGDQSCKKCHATEFKEWKQSHHYMSMLPPNDSTVVGDFNNVTFKPRASRIAPREAEAMPLPKEETTPPVTKIY